MMKCLGTFKFFIFKCLNLFKLRLARIIFITVFVCVLSPLAKAQVACPDDSVNSVSTGDFAYHLMNSGSATCSNNVAIPVNGLRIFSSWLDCGNGNNANGGGRFTFVANDGGVGMLPDPLTCDNCLVVLGRDVTLAPGTMANVTARFVLSGGTEPVIYRGQITRSALDVNGDSMCSLSNASITGGAFGGDATQPTATIGSLILQSDDTYTATITLSEASTNFALADVTLVNASATLAGSGTSYIATLTPSSAAQISLSVAAATFTDAADNDNLVSNTEAVVPTAAALVVMNVNDNGTDSLRDVVDRVLTGGIVTFDTSLAGQTITLTSGDIDLTKNVTIDGGALSSQVAISGNSVSRVFQLSNNRSVTLNALTLQDGSAANGGLINGANGVTLDISDSTFQRGEATSEGGAIRVFGSTSSTIIRRSLFTQNTASNDAPAISNNAGDLSVINTTLTNNTGFFAISSRGGDVSVNNSSVVDNTGAGIFFSNTGGYHLSNTVISGNNGNGIRFTGSATLTTNTNNLCDNCSDITTTVQQDALIAPLADNGGLTLTHALYSNSPALNAGNNAAATGLTTDQRGTGFNRVLAGTVDIGAFEGSIAVPVQAVNLSASSNTGTETGTTAITLTATAAAAVTGGQSVNIAVSGTGITASDYTLSNTNITIANGQTTGTVTFTVQDDALLEGNETAILTISNPSAGVSLGTTLSQNISIVDSLNAPSIPNVSHGPPTICAGNSALLSWTGNLNSAGQWVVYSGSCGVTQLDSTTSSSSIVSPPANASSITYFVRGEGGSVVTPGMCGVHTVPITPREDGSFSYSATTYLTTGADPTPTITGVSGGTFSMRIGVGSNVFSINSTTGTIDLSATPPGVYTIEYETPGLCDGRTTQVITINDGGADISISDAVAVNEGNTGSVALSYTVSLSRATSGTVTVDFATANGTAQAGQDYTAIGTTTLTFNSGEVSKPIAISVNGDTTLEDDETVLVNLTNAIGVNVAIVDAQGSGSINNDDSAAVTIADVSGNEDAGPITITATLDNAVQGGFTVDLSSADGSATLADSDYTALSTTLTFTGTAGETQTTTVSPVVDTTGESDETLSVTQSNLQAGSSAINAAITISDTATVTIVNDDPLTLIVLNNTDNAPDSLRDIVSRAAAGDTIIFDPSLSGQTITLSSGEISLIKDVIIDGSALSDQVSVSGNDANRIFRINDGVNADLNALTFTNGNVANGSGGAILVRPNASINIVNSSFLDNQVRFDGGAIALSSNSTAVISGSLFTRNTAGIQGGAIQMIGATLTLLNSTVTGNSTLPASGAIEVRSSVTLNTSFTSVNSTVVDNASRGLLIIGPGDYHLSNMLLANNLVSDLRLLSSAVLNTNVNNLCVLCPAALTFTVDQAPLIAPLADNGGPSLTHALYSISPALNAGDNSAASGLTTDQRGSGFARVFAGTVDIGAFEGSIAAPVQAVNLSASANAGNEADTTVITLTGTASAAVTGDQSVNIAVSGTGISASDYALSNTSITIANGQTTGTVTFTVQDDALVEGAETATLTLSNPSVGLSLGSTVSQGIAITDNDSATVTISDASGSENGGAITVTATLNNAVQGGFSVDLSTADGSATTANSDYTAVTNATLTFTGTAGETQTINITPTADTTVEPNETVNISQSNVSGTSLDVEISDTAVVTINNDDIGTFSISSISQAVEGGSSGVFIINSSQPFAQPVTINLVTSGTATQGADFDTLGSSIELPALATEVMLSVVAHLDNIVDVNETVEVTISVANQDGSLIGTQNSAEIIIVDGDDADGDGVATINDNCSALANSDQADFEGDGIGDVCDLDDDGDGLSDAYELANGLNPFNSFDRDADPDNDGFTNLEEFEFGSDPQAANTDENNNGIPDSVEGRGANIVPILQLLLLND